MPTVTGDTHFFEAAQTLAQGLSQWALLIIGGSLVVIVSTSYYHPKTRRMRAAYFIFVPAWLLLALSIYKGTVIQRSYVAYMVAMRRTGTQSLVDQIAENVTRASQWQLTFLESALACLGLWLIVYLVWWVIRNE